MPLYDYECRECGLKMERFYLSYKDKPDWINCEHCGAEAKQILVPGHGGIQTDNDVPWLPGALEGLQDTDNIQAGIEKPIETRTEYKKFLKDKHIIPVE